MSEIRILERLRAKVPPAPRQSGIRLGIGDDCAIFRSRGAGEDLVFTTDLVLEDVHFRRTTHPAATVGRLALARGLSDIAAMGAEPRFCLLSLALAPWTSQRWLDRFYEGLLELAAETGTHLAGGDMARAGRFACDVVVCGATSRNGALRRDGARPGDLIYVSGCLGGSALGLESRRGAAWRRHLRPQPRLQLGRFLRGKATAAMDLSDGLSLDLHRLCKESRVAAELTAPLPVFPGASLDQALHGGEDYELLFTARLGARLPARHRGVSLTRIGVIRRGQAGAVLLGGKRLPALGYDHFRRPRVES